jgi:hypothetical protein
MIALRTTKVAAPLVPIFFFVLPSALTPPVRRSSWWRMRRAAAARRRLHMIRDDSDDTRARDELNVIEHRNIEFPIALVALFIGPKDVGAANAPNRPFVLDHRFDEKDFIRDVFSTRDRGFYRIADHPMVRERNVLIF